MNSTISSLQSSTLAIHGGIPIRRDPMPFRTAFGDPEKRMLDEAIAFYSDQNMDPGYQGTFEKKYTEAFVDLMGGGYADAVATGTAALYVSLAAFQLPSGSEVLVSPITDPGTLSAIILNSLVPRVMDSMPDHYNIGPDQFSSRISPKVKAAVIVHAAGQACDIGKVIQIAKDRNIKVVEDCSQAHGATFNGSPVGSFGDIAAFSTMYRKAHITGGSGGVVFTRNLELYQRTLAFADRGKPRWSSNFDDRNPNTFLFPALNLHTDELSCAIGIASLQRLKDTISRRISFVQTFDSLLRKNGNICQPYKCTATDSPFFYPIILDPRKIRCSKIDFAIAISREGIDLNPHYQYLVADWPWLKPYLADQFDSVNARLILNNSFNLYLNENYGEKEAHDVIKAIQKVEKFYGV